MKDNKKVEEVDEDFKYIVRIASTDINGKHSVARGLTTIRGIGNRMATAIVNKSGVDGNMKMGKLTDGDTEKLEAAVQSISSSVPLWYLNHQKDPESGEDKHIIGQEIELKLRDEINLLRKIRCYRGIRHETGKKVRGQKTKSNGRRGLTMGVSKKKR